MQALLRWYVRNGRHELPWRLTRDPYAILVSEVMLQQTQVDRVVPYWIPWMQRWPTFTALARAKRAEVTRAWAGLGYNSRAVRLHRLAEEVCAHRATRRLFSFSHELENGQEMDERARTLRALPGIGPYTANALLAFAWNLPAPCVDTNVRRVLAMAILKRQSLLRAPLREVMRAAKRVIPPGKGRIWNYALMDYGALVLRARDIPNRPTRSQGTFKDSSRFWRGRIVAALRGARRPMPMPTLRRALGEHGEPPPELDALLAALVRDGVVCAARGEWSLA